MNNETALKKNIFSILSKYNSANNENYLTESLAFILENLLSKDRSCGVEFLNRLCMRDGESNFNNDEVISISTQESTEKGRPDIKISSPDKLIYIEIKGDSILSPLQLERYREVLDSKREKFKQLILLTRFLIDFNEHEEKPDKHIRWFEVYDWLTNCAVKDPVNKYLIDAFKSFLEVKQLSINKVSWEYINGVPALLNLLNMIQTAIEKLHYRIYRSTASARYHELGFYIENNEMWCGIIYDEALVVVFWLDSKTFNSKPASKFDYPIEEAGNGIRFCLKLEDKHFFSLDKDSQFEELSNFIKACKLEAEKMKLK